MVVKDSFLDLSAAKNFVQACHVCSKFVSFNRVKN